MGKKKRRMSSPKFAKKFAAKFAKFKAALKETVAAVAETYKEVIEEQVSTGAPKVVAKEVDESATTEPKLKWGSAKNLPRKKSLDLKKKFTEKKTFKRKTVKKN